MGTGSFRPRALQVTRDSRKLHFFLCSSQARVTCRRFGGFMSSQKDSPFLSFQSKICHPSQSCDWVAHGEAGYVGYVCSGVFSHWQEYLFRPQRLACLSCGVLRVSHTSIVRFGGEPSSDLSVPSHWRDAHVSQVCCTLTAIWDIYLGHLWMSTQWCLVLLSKIPVDSEMEN